MLANEPGLPNTHCKGSQGGFQRGATEGEERTQRRGAAQSKRRGRRPSQPLAGAPQPRCRLTGPRPPPPWKSGGSPQAAHTRGRCAGPAFPGARAGAEAWPVAAARSSGLAAQRFEPSSTGQRAEGRLRPGGGGAASSPARTSVAVSPPRAEREQQQVFRGRLGWRQRGSRPQQASTRWRSRAAHSPGATGRPRQVSAPPGPGTPLPLPGDSARSCRRCRPRAPGARAPRRSLRAITYRAVRGRRARGRGARPEPSNRLTRECRSQSRGRPRAAPTGLQRAARFCLRRSPRSAPHPRTGPAPSRTSLPIGPSRPRPPRATPPSRGPAPEVASGSRDTP